MKSKHYYPLNKSVGRTVLKPVADTDHVFVRRCAIDTLLVSKLVVLIGFACVPLNKATKSTAKKLLVNFVRSLESKRF